MKKETYIHWPIALVLGFIMGCAALGGLLGLGLSKVLFQAAL